MRSGTVAEVTASVESAYVEVDDVPAAFPVLSALAGVRGVEPAPPGLIVWLDGARRSDLVAALVSAGLSVDTVMARRSLEDAFLQLVGEHAV